MDISDVIEKVKKLLALTKSSNAGESANAARAANKLIDAYRLSQADIEQSETTESVTEDDQHAYVSGRVTRWKEILLMNLTKHYGAYLWNDCHWPNGRKVSRYRLVGRRSDIDIIKFLFSWISSECQRLCDLEGRGKGKVFCNSYCLGFVSGIKAQLASSRTEVAKEYSSNALVKIDQRAIDAVKYAAILHPNLKAQVRHSGSMIDPGARDAGFQQGKNFHLGKNLDGGPQKLLK